MDGDVARRNTVSFGCWSRLTDEEKKRCFDAKSSPTRDLQFPTQKLKAWRVNGPLAAEWNAIVQEIRLRTRSDGSSVWDDVVQNSGAVVRWTLYLVGKKADIRKLKPVIVAECRDIETAKRACKTLQEWKRYSLSGLLSGYDIHYAQVLISLCARHTTIDSSTTGTSSEDKFSLCGAQVTIRNQADGETRFTNSTIGGAILIDGNYFGMTAAHAFPNSHSSKGNSRATSFSSSSEKSLEHPSEPSSSPGSDRLVRQDTQVYLDTRDVDRTGQDQSLGSTTQLLPQNLLNSSDAMVLLNRSQDWALVPIKNSRFQCANSFLDLDASWRTVAGITNSKPPEEVTIVAGVSGTCKSTFLGASSLVMFPGTHQLQVAWSTSHQTGKFT